jgi:dihydropyrimidinase
LNDGAILDEFQSAVDYGVTSFKCFLVYKKEGLMVDDGSLVKILLKAKEVGAMTNIHAENPDLIDMNIENFKKEGKLSAWYHYMSRPEFVEAEADKRAVHWAKSVDGSLYIVHMADKEGLEAAVEAKRQGYDIYIETCPQYLEFTNDVYKREDGRNFVCSPPMKGKESQAALWEAIKLGAIDTVATDHCPFQSYEKDWGKDDFTKIPNGCAGVENLYPYMLSAANEGKISFNRAVELCSENPAKIFGCADKGSIIAGKDADIVIYDPNKDFTISVDNMHSDYDHTIWEGIKVKGYPVQTYVRGSLVYDDGEFVGKPGFGKYVVRQPKK